MNPSTTLFYERRNQTLIIDFRDRRTGNRRGNNRQFQPERRRLASLIRENEREPVRIPARLKTGSTEMFGFTQDIGLGGLKLFSNIALGTGAPIHLQLSFGESVCFLNIAGQVVFCNQFWREETTEYVIGIKFSAIRELDQKILAIALQTLKQNLITQEKSLLEIIISNDILAQGTADPDVTLSTLSDRVSDTSHPASIEVPKGEQKESARIKEVLTKSAHGIIVNDKRKFFRTLLRLPIQLSIEGATYKTYVEDISPAGMLVASPLVLPIDTPLAIQLSINENKYIMNISGRIAVIRESLHHQDYPHRIGICFDILDKPEEKILRMYLETLKNIPEKPLEDQRYVTASDTYARQRTAIIFIKDKQKTERQITARRVVITGIGAVAPNGIGREAFWRGLAEGTNCVDRISFFDPSQHPSQVAAEIKDFDPRVTIPVKEVKRMGRSAHLGVVAAQLAVQDSLLKLTTDLKHRIGVIVGTGTSGIEYAEDDFYAMRQGGVRSMRPYAAIAGFGGALSSEISRALGITGSSLTISTGCTGSTDAIGYAFNNIRCGMTDILLTGGSDACITPGILGAFCQIGATCTNFNNDPKRASRPFNKDRNGFVIGEGAWMFVLEELNHALRRGAKIYGEVVGYGTTCDAYHMSRPLPSGQFSVEAIRLALLDAMVLPEEIDYVNAYGNGTRINDSYETMVFKLVFGQHAKRLMISSIKSMIGHSIGSCGAAGVAAILMVLSEGIIPPTINYEVPDPECDLDYVPNFARTAKVNVALCNTLAFGAKNSVLILRRLQGVR